MTNHLPQTGWTQRPDLAALTDALGADSVRWVGGAVRDTLLGVDLHDVDAATTHAPERVIELCTSAEIRTVPTGIDHGTVTAVLKNGPVEITTLRRDVATDGRRATITYATEWKDDAARRDFTINALYAHPETLIISDYFGGLGDLEARRVRFIGDAEQRIVEDHLRILRYYRFQARFGAGLDGEAEEACARMAGTLKGLSRERIADELLKLLTLPAPFDTIARMHQRGVLGVVLPETTADQIETLERLTKAEAEQTAPLAPIRRLAALLPPSKEIADTCAARLRLSKGQRARLINAAQRNPSDTQSPLALAYKVGAEFAQDRLLLLGEDARILAEYAPPQFPLKGGQIVARGVAAGPEVARILQSIERRWITEGFPNAGRVEELLDEELRQI